MPSAMAAYGSRIALRIVPVRRHASTRAMRSATTAPIVAESNFSAVSRDAFAVTALNTDFKLLTQRIALSKNTDYVVTFEISDVSGHGMVEVDFLWGGYDNNEQEFHLHLSPADSGMRVERVLNSGDAPPQANMRVFSSDAVKFTVRNVRVSRATPLLSSVQEGAFAISLALFPAGLLLLHARYYAPARVHLQMANQRLLEPDRARLATRAAEVCPAIAIAGMAIWTVGTTALMVRRTYSALPWGDAWDTWRLFIMWGQHYSSKLMFVQHGEHRITVPRMFFLIDHYWFQARNLFLLTSIFLLQAAHAALIWRLGVCSGIRSWLAVLTGGMVAALMFSAQQNANLTWGFQIQFICVYAFSTLALAALARAATQTQMHAKASGTVATCVAVVCVAATIATYSMANGVLIWGVAVVMALALDLPRGWVGLVLLCGFLNALTYLWGYHVGGGAEPLKALGSFRELLLFAGAYIGAPTDPLGTILLKTLGADTGIPGALVRARVMLACAAGAAGGLTVAGFWLSSFRCPRWNGWQLALLYNCLFVMATSIVVALGRLTNFGLGESLTSRYTTPSLVFWSSLLVLMYSRFQKGLYVRPVQMIVINTAMAAGILMGVATLQFTYLPDLGVRGRNIAEASMAIGTGVYDLQTWSRIYHSPETLLEPIAYLKSHRLSTFAEPWTGWMGSPVDTQFRIDAQSTCVGHFEAAVPVESWGPGWRVSGWAWDTATGEAPQTIVIADPAGTMVGMARNLDDRPEVLAANPRVGTSRVGWYGFAGGSGHQDLSAFAIKRDGRTVCLLGHYTTTTPPSEAPVEVPFEALGNPIQAADVSVGSSWRQDGYPPLAGGPPVPGAVYGSWSEGQVGTGAIRLRGFVLGDEDIAVPVLTGAGNAGLSVEIVDPATGAVLARLVPGGLHTGWWAWRPSLQKRAAVVDIIAEDRGMKPETWLTIGLPHIIKGKRRP